MKNSLLKALDGLSLFFFGLCGALVIFGGIRIRLPSSIVEIGEINAWAVLALLLFLPVLRLRNSKTRLALERLIDAGLGNGRKFFIGGLFFIFIVTFAAHVARYLTFTTNLWDMGIVHNSLFFPFEGKTLSCEICRNQTYLGEHLSFTFLLVAPLAAFLKSNLFIFALQKAIVLGALFLFAARGPLRRTPSLAGWWLFLVFANEGFRSGLLFDFREDILIYAFLMLASWALWRGKKAWLIAGVFGALLSKENAFSSTLLFSGTILFAAETPWNRRQRRQMALVVFAVSIAYMIISFKFLLPLFHGVHGQEQTALMSRFPGMGKTPSEMVSNFILHPLNFLTAFSANFFSLAGVKYFFLVSAVGFFCGYRAWPWLLPAAPGIFFNMLSNSESQKSLGYHYDLIVVVWIAVAIAFGLQRWQKEKPALLRRNLLTVLILSLLIFGRSPLFYFFERLAEDRSRIPSVLKAGGLDIEGPMAADSFVLTSFLRVKKIRYFIPVTATSDPLENRRRFLASNPPLNQFAEGRSPQDALTWAIRTGEPDQAWLIGELESAGGRPVPPLDNKSDSLIVYRLERPLFEIWCHRDHLCQTSPASLE